MKRALLTFTVFLMILSGTVWSAQEDTLRPKEPKTRADSARIWYSIGVDYFRQGQYRDAIRNFRRALSYDSTFTLAYLRIASAFLEMKEFDSAQAAYEMVAKIDPSDSRGWQGLGFMYGILRGDLEKGIYYYRKALEVDPGNNDARFGLAKLLDRAGKREEADSLYEQAIQNDPENPGIRKAYGLFLYEAKRYTKAVPNLEKAVEAGLDGDLKLKLADAYRYLADSTGDKTYLEKALGYADEILAQDTTNVLWYVKRGDLLERLGRKTDALADYDRAIQLRPDYVVPYLKKANLLVELKRLSEARKTLEEAMKLEFPSDDYKAAALALYGDVYLMLGNLAYKQGNELRKAGQEMDAREKYSQAVEYYDKAKAQYQKVLKLQSRWADYASKQISRVEKKRKRAWEKSQGLG